MDTKPIESMSKEELLKFIEECRPDGLILTGTDTGFRVNYRSLVEAASDIIFVLDTKGNVIGNAWFDNAELFSK